jgi:hypothetical protein
MDNKLICIIIIVFFSTIPAAFAAGGKVTIHNARFVYSLKYVSKSQEHTINFDPQNEGGQYRLKGKRNFQILEVYINENGKERTCKCGDNALFRWRTRHPVDVKYKSEYEGFDKPLVTITGTFEKQFKAFSCPCE